MEEIYELTAQRLTALGCDVTETALAALPYDVDRAGWELRNALNRTDIPEGLRYVWADMAAGSFLRSQRASGALDEMFAGSTAPVASVKEGDTTVSFAVSAGSSSPEARFDALAEQLSRPDPAAIARYRRLEW